MTNDRSSGRTFSHNALRIGFAGALMIAGCVKPAPAPEGSREVAGQASVQPKIAYIEYNADGTPRAPEIIDSDRWSKDFAYNARRAYLLEFYYANTRGISRSGKLHDACFLGRAQDVAGKFFDETSAADSIAPTGTVVPHAKPSSNGQMISISFNDPIAKAKQPQHYFFRMEGCSSGKSPILPADSQVSARDFIRRHIDTNRSVAQVAPSADIDMKILKEGFVINDQLTTPDITLPTFKLKADYDKAFGADDLPWRALKLNIQNPKDALTLALLLQRYFYQGMANQNKGNVDMNFIASQSAYRYWCNMPWQNQGPSGREAVHGLTKERNLVPSPQMTAFKKPLPAGTDWGVGYYNAVACGAIQKVFGTEDQPLRTGPDFSKANYDDGSMAAKILFTTGDFPAIHNAYTWRANLSGPGQNTRSVQTARHIQMDISLKDSTLAGSNPALGGWMMFTYYYDDNFNYEQIRAAMGGVDNPLAEIDMPASLFKMRPMGIQFGMNKEETILFPGAETNGFEGRLNGPADNPVSSCLSCHSTAGTKTFFIPGFMSDDDYTKNREGSLDFSQQFVLAQSNYETIEDPTPTPPAPAAATPAKR